MAAHFLPDPDFRRMDKDDPLYELIFPGYPPSRVFRWKEADLRWYWPFITGTDEFCNRTIGVKVGRGVWFLALNVPLRRRMCNDCARLLLKGAD